MKIWLRNILEAVDDDALKDMEWKKQVGKYLVRAKYLVLEFLDDDSDKRPSLEHLKDGLQRLARETDVRHLPDYAPIQEAKLIASMDRLQDGKRELGPNDRLFIETEDKTYEVNLRSTWEPSDTITLTDAKETHSYGELILTIRRPDLFATRCGSLHMGATPSVHPS